MHARHDLVKSLMTIGIILIVAALVATIFRLAITVIALVFRYALPIGVLLVIIALIIYWIEKKRQSP